MALRALRNAVSELKAAEMDASARDEALRRAYPIIPERVLEDTADYDYSDPNRSDSPVDWHYRTRFVVCRCMRVAYEEG